MKYTLKDIGRLIRESREITGMSLTEFADLIGEDKSNLSKIERGELNIKLDRFLKIIDQVPLYFRSFAYLKKTKPDLKSKIFKDKLIELEIDGKFVFEENKFKITKLYASQVVNKYKNESGKKFSIKSIGSEIFVIRNK